MTFDDGLALDLLAVAATVFGLMTMSWVARPALFLARPAQLARVDASITAATEPETKPEIAAPAAAPGRLTPERQFDRLRDIIGASIATAHNAEGFHRAAREQLDAADYAIQILLAELSTVMPQTAQFTSARPSSVTPLRTARRPAYPTALAA